MADFFRLFRRGIYSPSRGAGIVLLIAFAGFTGPAAQAQPALAQPVLARQPLKVRSVHDMHTGTVLRLGESSVDYYSDNAAVFAVTGDVGREVQMMVSTMGLTQADMSSGRSRMALTIPAELCAYSIDDGATWTPFNPTMLWQEMRFPSRGNPAATIVVRVGGRMSASADQHRGNYSGTITLTAIYK